MRPRPLPLRARAPIAPGLLPGGVFLSVFLSEALALGSAAAIALSAMFIAELKGRVPVLQLARWQMVAAFAMTALAATAVGGWASIDASAFGLLALSSLFGIMIASTTYFAAIYAAGPRTTALLFSLTAPFALALGYGVLGETISAAQGVGVALVLGGIVLAVGLPRRGVGGWNAPSDRAAGRNSLWGIALGVITALGQALGSLFARPAMADGAEPFAAMAVRAGLAALFFVCLAALPFARGERHALTGGNLSLGVTSAFFGTGLGMSLLMAALQEGDVGIVSTLSSMTPVLILPMVWLRSGEAPPPRAWAGAALAIAGTALISLG
ncbi:MAG: EamA family transporter [Mesorhizobium amorphae]|nr:MAG: EamA family transporter [Mesorhizobium amorphae]